MTPEELRIRADHWAEQAGELLAQADLARVHGDVVLEYELARAAEACSRLAERMLEEARS